MPAQRRNAGCGGDDFAGGTLCDDPTGRLGIDSLDARDEAQHQALLAVRVTFVESYPVGEVFDGITVEIDLEFVHSLRVVARSGDVARDRVTNVHHEHGAPFTTENIKICDVEADVLTSDR